MTLIRTALVFAPYVGNLTVPPLAPALLKSLLAQHAVPSQCFDFNLLLQRELQGTVLDEILSWITTPDIKISHRTWQQYQKFIKQCAQRLIESKCTVVGISVFSHESQRFCEDLCWNLRQTCSLHIVLGGSGTTTWQAQFGKTWADLMVKGGLVDCVVIGEAEHIIADVVINRTQGIVVTDQLPNEQLQDLPVPDFSDYALDSYAPLDQIQIPITASKGCVRRCSFCDVASIWPRFRYRRGANVADEIMGIYNNTGIKRFTFTDSLINGGLGPFREMNQILAERLPRTIEYSGQFICRDPISMPPRDFELMRLGGCWMVNIGIESGSRQVREHMKKGFSNADIDYTAHQLMQHGIQQWWNIFVGYPTETEQDWQATLDLIKRYAQYRDVVKINPVGIFQLLRGTPITEVDSLTELAIVQHETNGYSEFNWVSASNCTNDLACRRRRWYELLDLIQANDMLAYSQQRLNLKNQVIEQQFKYYESQSNRPRIEIRQQSFQEPVGFLDQ